MSERLPAEPSSLTPVFRVGFCLLALLLPAFMCLLLPQALTHYGYDRSGRARCANALRSIGISAIQYADDKRFFPHVNPIRELDGDYDSNHTPRAVRALMSYGYHDTPEAWICPSSYDLAYPMSADAREDLSAWSWGGETRDPGVHPFAADAEDPTLRETSELSYGWTRKGMNANVRSTQKLAADRAVRTPDSDSGDALPGEVGNHGGGLNVIYADASVEWLPTRQPLDPELFEGIELLNLYHSSLAVDPVPGSSERRERFVRLWGPPIGVLGLFLVGLGWTYHMGWRRRFGVEPGTRRAWLTADVDGVGKPALGAEPRVNAKGKPKVTLSPNQRCPFCHDPLAEEDDLVACVSCQTLLHRECVQEGGTCSTLGCGNTRKGF